MTALINQSMKWYIIHIVCVCVVCCVCVYVCVLCCVSLSVCVLQYTYFFTQVLPHVVWYTERSLTNISLGSLMVIVLVRTIQTNMTHIQVNNTVNKLVNNSMSKHACEQQLNC